MDIDDDLLALAEGAPSKRKSKSSGGSKAKPSAKKRRQSAPAPVEPKDDSASDMDMDSDDDGDNNGAAPPSKARFASGRSQDNDSDEEGGEDLEELYPIEGKYKDEGDRESILLMTELEREKILGEREDERHKIAERRALRQMVAAKEKAEGKVSSTDSPVRSGRDRQATGVTEAKQKGLERLRETRSEKGKKRENGGVKFADEPSSPQRRDSSSDAYSSDDSEDYDKPTTSKSSKSSKASKIQEPASPADLESVTLTRTKLAEFCVAPWFKTWVVGAFVRYLVGPGLDGLPAYRLCEVSAVDEFPKHPYRFEGVQTDLQLELKFGSATRWFTMEAISNAPSTSKEFGRLSQTLTVENDRLPYQSEIAAVKKRLDEHKTYTLTEADVARMVEKNASKFNTAQSKLKLIIQRDFARSNGNDALLAEVNAKIAEIEGPAQSAGKAETEAERMKKVNERNRASNREDIKKAESRNQEARMKQAAALARGDTDVKIDASARVKTLTRLTYDREPTSRPATPNPGTPSQDTSASTPVPTTDLAAPVPRARGATKLEMMASQVEVDIDLDF